MKKTDEKGDSTGFCQSEMMLSMTITSGAVTIDEAQKKADEAAITEECSSG